MTYNADTNNTKYKADNGYQMVWSYYNHTKNKQVKDTIEIMLDSPDSNTINLNNTTCYF